MNDFIKELKALLEKHNASISFGCSDSSDLYGIDGEYTDIDVDGKTIIEINGWGIDSSDL